MKNTESSAEDLKAIRKIMEESTRFLSLSGFSGIFLGLFAIAGAVFAWFFVLDRGNIGFDRNLNSFSGNNAESVIWKMLAVAFVVFVFSVTTAIYLSFRNAKQSGISFWSPASRRLLLNLIIPLAAGGIFALILSIQNHILLIIPVFLIFYGLALINAGKFTYSEIFYLGLFEIFTGLLSALFPAQGLLFWILGFGILHIVYGVMMYRRYEV